MLQYNPTISGSLNITGSLIISNGMIGTVNGVDVEIFSSSISQVVTNIQTTTGSQSGRLTSIESFTSSTSARLGSIETISASNLSRINSIETITSSNIARLNSIETITASNIARLNAVETITASNIARLNAVETITASNIARLTSLEITTGSLATTGSNTFIGTQTITGSLFISSNLVVQGTSSLQNITASAVSIGTNIVNLNTANPAIRYAGLVIGDSGSVGGSGSFLYDSVQDEMLFIHRGSSTVVTSSVTLMGPETYDSLGNETYPTLNIIQKGNGNEHLGDSCIFDNGTTVCISTNLRGTANACFSSAVCSCASNTLYAYFDGNNTVLPNPTDRPHIFRTSSGGLGLSANNEGAVSQPISMYTCGAQRFTILPNGNVGIGTCTPTSTYGFTRSLVVSNPTNAEISLEATTCNKVLSIGVTNGFNYFQTTTGNGYDFQIGGGSKMIMASTGITTFVCQVCISVARTSGTNSTALILQDNVTGIQTPGFGLRLVYQSNGTGVQSVIGLENGNTGTNNESQISFYTQNTAGGLSKRLLIDASGIACFSNVVCAASFGQIKGDSTNDVHSFTNDNAGNTYFCNRSGRLLTSNGAGWSGDGRDPIMALVGSYSCTSRGISIGLALHNENNTTNVYSPMIAFSALSNSSGYNSTYASIMGKKTGTASSLDTNWNKGELHFYAHGETYIADTPTMVLSSVGVTKPFQPFVYGGLASDQSITTSNPTKVNFVANAGHFGCNVGGHWNNSTNQLTAPVTGVYLVNISGYWSTTNLINQFAAHVNNNRKVSIPTGYCTNIAGGSMMVPMAAGETMDFRVYNDVGTGTLYQNVYHTFFSIYLLG